MARGTNNNGGHKGLSYTKFGYIFIAPFCIVYLIFSMYPLLTTFWYSVCNPKSTTADFWGFSDKDVYYDQYLDLSSKSVYSDEAAFTEATGLTYDEYRLIKDYFSIQKAANDCDVMNKDNLNSIIAIGTSDNGNGYSLSNDTIAVLQQMVNDNSISPLTQSYLNDYENNVYTDLASWNDSYYDPQAYVRDNMDDIHDILNAIANPETSDDATEDSITSTQIINNGAFEKMIEGLSADAIAEYTPEQQAIIKAIEEKIGQDDLGAYFESIVAGENSIEDPGFYYAVRNLSNSKSAYNYMTDADTPVAAMGVMAIDDSFMTSIEKYLAKNSWVSSITSLSTFDSMESYPNGEKDVFADKAVIASDLEIIDNLGIMALVTYDVEGDEITVRKSTSNKLGETLTSINIVIEKNKPSDEKLFKASQAISGINKYYKTVVVSTHGGDGEFVKINDALDLSKISAVDHANYYGFDVEKYVSYNGKLDIKSYREYKTLVGLSDKLSIAKYEEFDQKMKDFNKAQAEAIIATTYQDPAVKDGTISSMNIDDDGNLFFDVDVKNQGSDEVIIVKGNSLQEQLDFITPLYEQHVANDADIINMNSKEKTDSGIRGGNGVDRFDIRNVYYSVYYRLLNANRQIANPTGVLTYVDATNEYIFAGSDNFKSVFTDKTTRDTVFGSFAATAILWVMGFVPQILLALILSSWFTDNRLKLKGLNLMKALMYLPNVITAVTIAIFFRRIFSYSTGGSLSASQIILRKLTGHGYNFFVHPWASRWLVAFINFWMWYGNTMIVLIAGITSINESLFESAQIDGANAFQTYTKITLPLLRPILLYTFVSSLIGGLQMYDIPKNIINTSCLINFNGTRIYSLRTVLMYVNEIAFGAGANKMIGVAAAVSVILFIVTTILSIVIFYIMRDKDAAKAAKAKKLARKAVK